jgi:hypothetical protein
VLSTQRDLMAEDDVDLICSLLWTENALSLKYTMRKKRISPKANPSH